LQKTNPLIEFAFAPLIDYYKKCNHVLCKSDTSATLFQANKLAILHF